LNALNWFQIRFRHYPKHIHKLYRTDSIAINKKKGVSTVTTTLISSKNLASADKKIRKA